MVASGRIRYNRPMDGSGLERETQRIGRQILGRLKPEPHSLFKKEWWQGQILRRCMENEALKIALFRFVDVLPNLKDSNEIVRVFREYLDRPDIGEIPFLSWGMKTLVPGSPTVPLAAAAIRKNVEALASQFIAGRDLAAAGPKLEALWRAGISSSVSMVGEVAVNEAESEAYLKLYSETIEKLARLTEPWPNVDGGVGDRFGPLPRANLALKLSSIYSQLDPLDFDPSLRVLTDRLESLLILGRQHRIHLHLDMEHYAFKDLILEAFFRAMARPELSDYFDVGIVVQAYLKESEADLSRILEWARKHRPGLTIRLVRGAYWDYETVTHRQNGWPVPVYLSKGETDANYERLTDQVLAASDYIRAAFGSHNVRSLARAVAAARGRSLPDGEYEFQMLYGMGGPLPATLTDLGFRVRIYAPVGERITGMAYLVRRLLENTSNESFLRSYFVEGRKTDDVLKRLEPKTGRDPEPKGFRNEPPLEFRRAEVRADFARALVFVRERLGRNYPLIIDGEEIETTEKIDSVNPALPGEIIGRSASAGPEHGEQAVTAALAAQGEWAAQPAHDRAEVLRKAAEVLRERRLELAAWEVLEVAKTWREADADVTEAVDFLRYYADEIERLDEPRKMGDYPGERNRYAYSPIGIGAVIAPWNFPLAIPAGMVAAGLAAGNAVLFKPSELSPVMGWHLVSAFRKAGLPEGVLAYLPGRGEAVGNFLVKHPRVGFIAFTGSQAVGLSIVTDAARMQPGQRHVKRVVAEMGGKNAVIVDGTADLDQAVLGVVTSAVGYSGQKCSACSRVIVMESVYDIFLHRLSGALSSLRIGSPEDPGTQIGPVIEATARDRLNQAIEAGAKEGRLVLHRTDLPKDGFFIGPAVIADVAPESRLAQEELFGPVVAVIRAKDLSEALRIANATDYALTGGLYSRSPAAIARVSRELAAGNIYINRSITGALVNRQPFGGYRLSGVGSKAGGPDYLLQFMIPKVVTENTLRRGFAPPD